MMDWFGWALILVAWIITSIFVALGMVRWFRWLRGGR